MRYSKLLFLLIISITSHAQKLSAKVVDENNEPLVGATVYFDGTTRGVITGVDGIFNIDKPENLNKPILVITYLGYEALYDTNIENLKKVYQLKPKAESLDIVDLYASPFSREDMLKVFKENFLGKGKAARQTEILNLDDVIVYYVVKENTLYAKSANPIVVQNDYLGYKVKFDLKAFEVEFYTKSLDNQYLKRSFYAGFSFFEDTNPIKAKRREKIYERSLSCFFKNLIENTVDKTNFQVAYKGFLEKPYDILGVKPIEDNLFQIYLKPKVIKALNGKRIPTKILLKYKSSMSTIQFQETYFRAGRFGNNIDLENILLIGDLAESKVAEMLPVNFGQSLD